jgi:hypothetical protein
MNEELLDIKSIARDLAGTPSETSRVYRTDVTSRSPAGSRVAVVPTGILASGCMHGVRCPQGPPEAADLHRPAGCPPRTCLLSFFTGQSQIGCSITAIFSGTDVTLGSYSCSDERFFSSAVLVRSS